MDFSFIIPAHNSGNYIAACLASICSVEYPQERYEVIVVDGGSTDDTLTLVRSFDRVRILTSRNSSISSNRNIGAAAAAGTWLVFIDSDCVVDRRLLILARRHLTEHACFGSFYKADERHGWVARTWLEMVLKPAGRVRWITGGTLAVSRAAFEAVNGFDENLQTEEDEDFCHRVRQRGETVYNDPSVASVHLGQADSLSAFFRKETWHGKSLIASSQEPSRKKASLFDTAVCCYGASLAAIPAALASGQTGVMGGAALPLFLLPLLMTIRSLAKSGRWHLFGQALILNTVFLCARSWSIVRYRQLGRLFSGSAAAAGPPGR